jgi:hypothetical protein
MDIPHLRWLVRGHMGCFPQADRWIYQILAESNRHRLGCVQLCIAWKLSKNLAYGYRLRVGVAIAGIFLFNESTSLLRGLCLLLILVGITGLKLIEG